MKIGDIVQFVDKTGELLKGSITSTEFDGDTSIYTVMSFKEGWDTEVSCLVPKESLRLVKNAIQN